MDKQQAIQWCVENVNSWPRYNKGLVSSPKKWFWHTVLDYETSLREKVLINVSCSEVVRQSEWVDAIIEMH